ncbi:tyrosine-type recombinase/integrase [Thalassotalea sp. PS06]|uniref:tyrosine-type recombinase/integrase n=1 Tax=Thalassotalea sp. PS06 TaxID=2594005 RepID=UPI0011659386|nr:tyrosine-type recombinase/integrase [Thalassotalea sp. PS06]QDP01565.1 tyrosine-type recombinase/integrase [Thalassotalea sp. PS06]
MKNYHSKNIRTTKDYLDFLQHAKGQNEASLDSVVAAIARFERYTNYKGFERFHFQQAIGFKRHLEQQLNPKTGKLLSKATINSQLRHLKRFFQWLSREPGYKSRIDYRDAEYFNLSEKSTRIANARREKPVPSLQQITHLLESMPINTGIEKRNRALLALTILTGARDSAIASLKLKHIDLNARKLTQDAREVKTKYSKSFNTYFFPVDDLAVEILSDWVQYLTDELLFGPDDPLFPKSLVTPNKHHRFEAVGLSREHWKTAGPIRDIFKTAFTNVNLPYFNPHSFRNTLVLLGEQVCKTPEEFKAWSQNLGHSKVLTSFSSYGTVPDYRQSEIMSCLSPNTGESESEQDMADVLERMASKLRSKGGSS